MELRTAKSMAMVGRAVGTVGAALSTLMVGILVVGLFSDPSAQSSAWLFLGPIGLILAGLGAWAWWQGRWGIAALGMWVATAADTSWYSAVLLPLALAISASILALKARNASTSSSSTRVEGAV